MSATSLYSNEIGNFIRALSKNGGEVELRNEDKKISVFIRGKAIFSEPWGMHPEKRVEFSYIPSSRQSKNLTCEWFKQCETSEKSKKEGFKTDTFVWKRPNPLRIKRYVHVRLQYPENTATNDIELIQRTVFQLLSGK